jgi:hypothetical protein
VKKYQLGENYSKEAIDATKNHLRMMGKDVNTQEATTLLDAIVRNNPNFPTYETIEDMVSGFYNAVHYGSHELKSATLLAHTKSFGEWTKNRQTIRPVTKEDNKGGKPDDWKYNPDEPLPVDITAQRARDLLFTIHSIYGTDTKRVMNSDNFMHYIDKLKMRVKGLA